MPKYRVRRKSPSSQAGMIAGSEEERVVELPAGMSPPPGAEDVAPGTALSDWSPVPTEHSDDSEGEN